MAITLTTAPSDTSSTKSPIIFRVTTDSTDITTQIQCKIYYRRIQTDYFTLTSTKLQKIVVGKNYYEFNVASILDKLLTADIKTGSTGVITDLGNSAIEYVLYFAEYYPFPLPVLNATTTTGFYYACNTGLYHTETQSVGTGTDWYMDGVASHKFLTDSPIIIPIRASERIQLDFLTSYTDPVIKVRETKDNLSTSTVTHELPNTTYTRFLWSWTVSASGTITILTELPYTYLNIISLSGTSFYKYMADSTGIMYGGVRLAGNNDILEIDLPSLAVASASINIRHEAVTNTTFAWEIYYYYSGTWNASLINPSNGSSLLTFATLTEVMPSGAEKVRIKKIGAGQELWIPYVTVTYVNDNVANKRCAFTLDTTHIDSDTKKLEIWAESTSSSGSVISEVRTFLTDKEAYYQNTTRFAAKNKRGGFDHFTYTEGHSEILTAEKTRSRRELPNTFTTKDRGLTVDKIVSEKIFTCYSRYIEEAELQWWSTIIESDEVYVIVNDVLYAIDIVTDSVISYTHTDLVQLKIDWTYAVTR